MHLNNFLDVGIVALNFGLCCLQERIEEKDIHNLLAFGDIIHFEGLNPCIVFYFDCNNNIKVIFAVQCGKKL